MHISQTQETPLLYINREQTAQNAQDDLRIQCVLCASDAGAIQFQVLK